MEQKHLRKPSVGDVLHHKTANGWYEEAMVVSVMTFKEVWRALLMTNSEATVVLGTGAVVRDENDWDHKVEQSASASPSKKRRLNNQKLGSA